MKIESLKEDLNNLQQRFNQILNEQSVKEKICHLEKEINKHLASSTQGKKTRKQKQKPVSIEPKIKEREALKNWLDQSPESRAQAILIDTLRLTGRFFSEAIKDYRSNKKPHLPFLNFVAASMTLAGPIIQCPIESLSEHKSFSSLIEFMKCIIDRWEKKPLHSDRISLSPDDTKPLAEHFLRLFQNTKSQAKIEELKKIGVNATLLSSNQIQYFDENTYDYFQQTVQKESDLQTGDSAEIKNEKKELLGEEKICKSIIAFFNLFILSVGIEAEEQNILLNLSYDKCIVLLSMANTSHDRSSLIHGCKLKSDQQQTLDHLKANYQETHDILGYLLHLFQITLEKWQEPQYTIHNDQSASHSSTGSNSNLSSFFQSSEECAIESTSVESAAPTPDSDNEWVKLD